jgi:hypothetical protein
MGLGGGMKPPMRTPSNEAPDTGTGTRLAFSSACLIVISGAVPFCVSLGAHNQDFICTLLSTQRYGRMDSFPVYPFPCPRPQDKEIQIPAHARLPDFELVVATGYLA